MTSNYDLITKDNIRRRGEEFDDIGHLISEQLYSDRSHFVYELLQNAEDALERRFRDNPQSKLPCSVKFLLFEDRLEFRHFGQNFTENDVRGISDVLRGTKNEEITQIGKFGIGFKSVYAFTAKPEIHSGDEHFAIERYIRPKAIEPWPNVVNGETVFIFPFNNKDLPKDKAFDLILDKLKKLGPRTLLFLSHIDEIVWSVDSTEENGQYLREIKNRDKATQVTVIGHNNGQDEEEAWLIFGRPVIVPNSEQSTRVEVGFLIETDPKDKMERISRINDAPLVVYFPTETYTKFGFLIQGPYHTTPARDNIRKNDDWNKNLIEETANLVVEALRNLKAMGLLSVSLLEALPIRVGDFPQESMFYPIISKIRDVLMDEELLPADEGAFVSARNAKLASAEWLRTLLQEGQLKQIFKVEANLKWISGEITDRLRHDLWEYFREELKVEEVTPDSVARKIDRFFLEKQTDSWMLNFYSQLGGQKALWKSSGGRWDNAGPLRSKEFIRLQDGSHVAPFRDDGSPNVYLTIAENVETSLPIIKTGLLKNKDVQAFLTELGIPELDIVAEVIEKVLPKYRSFVPLEEHKHDIAKIVCAYKTDSYEKKKRLKEKLENTAFILTKMEGAEKDVYRKPIGVYFPNEELKKYFFGNDNVGFVSLDYEESVSEMLESIGVSHEIRIGCKSKPGLTEIVQLDYRCGYRRGIKGFDPDINVDGLEFATKNQTVERSLIIWNTIAVPYSHCIKGKVLRSSRQDFSPNAGTYKEEEIVSTFGNLLINADWLPNSGQQFVKPCELSLDDLPDSFIRDEKLAIQLGMKRDVITKLAEEAGIPAENIELMKQYPEDFQKWKLAMTAKKEKPAFPEKESMNPERRQGRLVEQLVGAPDKETEERERRVRVTRGAVDPALWLMNQYTNDAGQMICQICKEEMPFKKRNGEYYFEAVEALSKDYFSKEHEAQFLALCPLCAAMYKEFVKLDENAIRALKNALMNSEGPEVSLVLGELKTSVRFVESHWQDIKTILQESGQISQ